MVIRGCLSGKTVYFYGKCGEAPVKTVFYRRFTGQQPDVDRSYMLELRKLSDAGMISKYVFHFLFDGANN
jgi:hypothetical protein